MGASSDGSNLSVLVLSLSKGEDRTERGTDAVPVYVYMLECRDGSYYVGTTRASLDRWVAEHSAGIFDGYTKGRRPVHLVFAQECQRITDAIAAERQIKGWSRRKKQALIGGDFEALPGLAKNYTQHPR